MNLVGGPAVSAEQMRREWRRRIGALACAATALGLAVSAMPAAAADSVYWYAFETPTINRAGLVNPEGNGALDIPGGIPSNVRGIAIDSAAGRLYWNFGDTIEFANLDGSGRDTLNTTGAVLDDAISLAIDSVHRRIYWANSKPDAPTIGFASLDGNGGGNLEIAGATRPLAPLSLLVHPAGGRIYWADSVRSKISFANLDGSGGGDLDTTGAPSVEPKGLAIDAGRQRIYWTSGPAAFGSASLAGGDGTELPLLGTAQKPFGLALDPQAGRLYWSANREAGNLIGSIPFPSGGTSTPLATNGANVGVGGFNPILLKKPTTFGTPVPSLAPVKLGDRLDCHVSWAGDLVEANLMQAPQTVAYQWLRNGAPIQGATAQTQVATEPGNYTCVSTATNFAGSATETGPPFTISPVTATKPQPKLKLLKTRFNRRKGTATLTLAVSGAGKLRVRGRKLAPVDRSTGRDDSTISVTLRPRGKSARLQLARKGVLKTKALVTLLSGGETRSLSTPVVLKKKPKR